MAWKKFFKAAALSLCIGSAASAQQSLERTVAQTGTASYNGSLVTPVAGGIKRTPGCRRRECDPPQAKPVSVDALSYFLMGEDGGQKDIDTFQFEISKGETRCFAYHKDWCNDIPPGGVVHHNAFHKNYLLSPEWEALLRQINEANLREGNMPEIPGRPFVFNMKTDWGGPVEFGRIADDALYIDWETGGVLPAQFQTAGNPRSFRHYEGKKLKYGILWMPRHWTPGEQYFVSLYEVRNTCGEISPDLRFGVTSTSKPKGVLEILGPYNLSTPQERARTIESLKEAGIVPPGLKGNEILPQTWYTQFPDVAGRSRSSVSLIIKKDYLDIHCGNVSKCKDLVETYWYLASDATSENPFGYGLVRWNVQSLREKTFYRQGTNTELRMTLPGQHNLTKFMCALAP